MRLVVDIEANNLLNDESIDYTQSPYKLKESFKIHVVVCKNIDTNEIHVFRKSDVFSKLPNFLRQATTLIAHNGIDYDFLVLKLALGLDYTVYPDTFAGKPCKIIDTLIVSKTLNPDRLGGHSLEAWGKRLGDHKIDFHDFSEWSQEMEDYCIQDVNLTHKVFNALNAEVGDWKWDNALELEHAVAEIVTRQSHRGFVFDTELAVNCVKELDTLIAERKLEVEPVLPPKPLGKTALKEFTPPKQQFLKSGDYSRHLVGFVEKHGGEFLPDRQVKLFDKLYDLPLPVEPLMTHMPSSLKDTTHIKEWLVRDLGWTPTQYKERDLTVNAKKQKLNREDYEAAVHKYVEQTLASAFCNDRLEHLDLNRNNLLSKLLAKDPAKPVKVLTNPTFTVGQEKELCPNLVKLESDFPYARKVVEFLTYTHRRNSILGGGFDPEEDDEPEKGYLASVRADGRIPTPAGTCDAGTSRFKHRVVANIPRSTSLYGDKMRSLFGSGENYQIGYDFDSLEAKIESHYVYRYPGGPEYGVSLTAEKPNDCHSVLARAITELIGKSFPRGSAKSVKYGCLPVDNTQVLTPTGWKHFKDIQVGSEVLSMDTVTGEVNVDNVEKVWSYKDAEVSTFGHSRWNVECTEDHRWFGRTKFMHVSTGDSNFYLARDFQTNFSVQTAGKYVGGNSNVTPDEAALVAWLLSDGYYKWSGCSSREQQGIVGSIAQASHKFQEEVKAVLTANNMQWKETNLGSKNENVNISYRLQAEQLRSFLDRVVGARKNKHDVDWVSWVLTLSVESMKAFLHNFWLADGSTTVENALVIKQNRGNISDAVIVAGNMLGFKVTQTGGKCSVIRMQKDCHVGLQTAKLEYKRTTDVFCITTRKGTFIMRQGGVVTVTGNCSYNAQPPRVAKIVGCDLPTATLIFDTFWQTAAPLKQLKEAMQKYWETTGQKKFLLGLDGRKLPIRSKGNVINTAFQSAGVICAKRAMVLHDRKLRAKGMIVDFFKDDWKSKQFCQQMIAYHDEAQLEVTKELVKFKMFKTEEEAKAFRKENPDWGEIAHTDKGYYSAYSEAGVLAVESVIEAGRYYKLNVDLSAGYIVHKNWYGCH